MKEKTKHSDTAVGTELKRFPVKCDHCPWTGTVGTARIVEDKARCPMCGGSLAANRTTDQVVDALHDLVNLEDNDF